MEQEPEGLVSILTHTCKEPLNIPGKCIFIAEDLYIYASKFCGIGPIARHLFGLWCLDLNGWLSPCQEIDATGSKKWSLEFKLRFKLPSIGRLEVICYSIIKNFVLKYYHSFSSFDRN